MPGFRQSVALVFVMACLADGGTKAMAADASIKAFAQEACAATSEQSRCQGQIETMGTSGAYSSEGGVLAALRPTTEYGKAGRAPDVTYFVLSYPQFLQSAESTIPNLSGFNARVGQAVEQEAKRDLLPSTLKRVQATPDEFAASLISVQIESVSTDLKSGGELQVYLHCERNLHWLVERGRFASFDDIFESPNRLFGEIESHLERTQTNVPSDLQKKRQVSVAVRSFSNWRLDERGASIQLDGTFECHDPPSVARRTVDIPLSVFYDHLKPEIRARLGKPAR